MFQIIPAIDLIDGHCVRLTKGDYDTKKVYNEDPLDVAKAFQDKGISRLHLVDLDGAKQKKVVNLKVLEKIASKTNLVIDFGGGVQSDEDIHAVFNSGAAMITGGSIAVKNPELFLKWLEQYGCEKIILGADAKDRKIAISGWEENSGQDIIDFVSHYTQKGIKYLISTDVSKDGLLQGPSTELYKELNAQFPKSEIIASGGVAEMKDIEELAALNIHGVIVGKAIYEGRIAMDEIQKFILGQ
ncbi:1-(5-phosphoribosyl)-5-[(5-phosphoribosylamino)methylideneamino]imidazole-4-carboxamide isomerase [Marinilongibacter aquaticus]|uniref:1-(5-phosphoribosyl)-5-[(5- phosphoribosylamino)methylideneamino]imidazole-4- carboxamide isomerase n=1 Tax=Marinilongibacter aquaticus TaxID=2975157 RepID=UPI0021BD6A82|nr:1-(5-phosphoribosyl)-5-[(5-phosphoribosylamino)methylideneamino]imidazole-4-carboxamide isomerase [Marinilongibacter aquaticus]UBM60533.1 1-(5-phosphoribosyl)-5-[(5-phosphoribosylamino)methylideneamino]imidazole-4-carboxamide isomerase [Marinilongibacter aquaticus]